MSNVTSERKPNRPGHGGGPMAGMRAVEKPVNFKSSLVKLLKCIKPFTVVLTVALIFAVASTVFQIIGPKILGDMTNEAYVILFGQQIDMAQISYWGLWLVILYALGAIFNYIQGFIMSTISVKITQKLRSQISEKINKLPLKYFDTTNHGDTLSRVTNDVDTIANTLNQSLSGIITAITTLIGVSIAMFSISWIMALVCWITIPIALLLTSLIVKFSQKFYKQQQQSLGDMNAHVEEIFSNHNIVKAFNGEEKENQKFIQNNDKLYVSGRNSMFTAGLMMPIMTFVGNLGYVLVSAVGGVLVLNGYIEPGSILSFLIYVKLFSQPLMQVASVANVLQSTVAASERVFNFLEEEELTPDCSTPKKIENVKGNVEFKNVCFGYSKNKQIINNFNVSVKAGQKVAIVGPTGAGKTTIVNLLERFYEIDSGDILIDGVSIKDLTRADVRNMFTMVLQDTWLFEGTIRDNIIYGKQNVTQEEVEQACKNANIHHFIMTLPNGYNYVLGDESNISQGQKQLLTIARATIQNAPMLILDEATSSVDTRTEELIQEAMDKLTQKRTSFVIAHRLSTIKNADIILVMKEGNIIEQGTHNELLKKNGFYAELYNSQFTQKEGQSN